MVFLTCLALAISIKSINNLNILELTEIVEDCVLDS